MKKIIFVFCLVFVFQNVLSQLSQLNRGEKFDRFLKFFVKIINCSRFSSIKVSNKSEYKSSEVSFSGPNNAGLETKGTIIIIFVLN